MPNALLGTARCGQDLDFYPSLLLQALRDQLAFQEQCLKTQLFVSLVDTARWVVGTVGAHGAHQRCPHRRLHLRL